MDVKFRVSGYNEVMARLNYVAKKVPDNARKALHRLADAIVKQAQINVPHDIGNLEESIRKELKYGYRGRLSIDIVMGGIVNGVNVDEYALMIHESYDDSRPGKNTQLKRQRHPGEFIGSKFLERAVDKYVPRFEGVIRADIERTIKDAK
jgi:hypothetical protein